MSNKPATSRLENAARVAGWALVAGKSQWCGAPAISDIALRHNCTAVQVVLRWHVQQGFVPTPKSAKPGRLAENFNIFGFAPSAEEMAVLDGLDRTDPTMFDADSFGH